MKERKDESTAAGYIWPAYIQLRVSTQSVWPYNVRCNLFCLDVAIIHWSESSIWIMSSNLREHFLILNLSTCKKDYGNETIGKYMMLQMHVMYDIVIIFFS